MQNGTPGTEDLSTLTLGAAGKGTTPTNLADIGEVIICNDRLSVQVLEVSKTLAPARRSNPLWAGGSTRAATAALSRRPATRTSSPPSWPGTRQESVVVPHNIGHLTPFQQMPADAVAFARRCFA